MTGINPADLERYIEEPPKDAPGFRRDFARDRARVLHSAAFRRLATKTQVHAPAQTGDGFLRTRLTHSLEVAQIAREMGEELGCDPDIVDTAGLAHDLGHPPFGHNGEDALDAVSGDCGGFEGNAQTLRVLVRLEAKIVGPDGSPGGLNLTRASLDAACKYPWARQAGRRKFGVYEDDVDVFDWLRAGVPATPSTETPSTDSLSAASLSIGDPRKCLEAQVMDWADDVAYSVHDVEDGVIAGFVRLEPLLHDADERGQLCHDVAKVYSSESPDVLGGALAGLLADPTVAAVAGFDGSARSLATLKRAASLLIGRFVAAAVSGTRGAYGPQPLRRYDADLVVPREVRAQCALLKGIALRYVMRRPGSDERYAREQEVLRELVAALVDRAPDGLDPVFAPLFQRAADDRARLRVIIDQVASLTDPAALAWHERLVRRRDGVAASRAVR